MLNNTSINESKIFVISAPSGGGKTSIVKSVLKDFPELKFSVSATTRPRRENEIDGVDYFFITEQEFLKKIQNQEFIEWERFYDYYYGTPKDQVYKAFENNYPILLELDVKGALNVKKIFPQAILIFIDVPSLDELVRRLQARKTENESDLKKRIERAKMELNYKNQFDYIFVNNKLEDVTKEVKNLFREILRKEK
ncbi:MAG: guanylate kinase [Ignavibacterium sp.]|nr:guanylate kinase [Ignavibacterium sp.]MDW8374721.1 guanylate kinase [Ignavibacteriales bacterium]